MQLTVSEAWENTQNRLVSVLHQSFLDAWLTHCSSPLCLFKFLDIHTLQIHSSPIPFHSYLIVSSSSSCHTESPCEMLPLLVCVTTMSTSEQTLSESLCRTLPNIQGVSHYSTPLPLYATLKDMYLWPTQWKAENENTLTHDLLGSALKAENLWKHITTGG